MSISACQSAAAIAAQMLSNRSSIDLFKAWNQTGPGLYLEIAKFGLLSESIAGHYSQDASGVYSYDVDEEFGDYLAEEILNGTYRFEKAAIQLRGLIAAFYCSDLERDQLNAINV